jgi:8-oxo-dGTP pyrophosphatase MutT (NUDIX family)
MVVQRHAVRAILLTPEYEVLLVRIHAPDSYDKFWWITPGGGIEPGESQADALRRELREELSLGDFVIGPLVWRRRHTFDWVGRRICQIEQYHVVRVERFEPKISDPAEAKIVDRFRWWSLAELAQGREAVTPLALADIVRRYLAEGPPIVPPDEEVLVD